MSCRVKDSSKGHPEHSAVMLVGINLFLKLPIMAILHPILEDGKQGRAERERHRRSIGSPSSWRHLWKLHDGALDNDETL